jgi:hypothetical protein
MISYALYLNDDLNKKGLLDQLRRSAKIKDDEMHWQYELGKKQGESKKIAKTIEIAAYALLANLKAENLEDSRKILKWLLRNRSEYRSVEEGVVLQALTEAARVFSSNNFNLDIYLADDDDKEYPIHIDQANELTPVNVEFPSKPSSVSIMANGTGIALLEVWWRFNLKADKISKSFDVSVEVDPKSSESVMMLKACTKSLVKETELAVMEVSLPSGFEFTEDSKNLLQNSNIKVKLLMYFH